MAEGTYEYECMRAELLGIAKPDYDDFLKKQQARAEVAEEEHEIEALKETDHDEEALKHASGGLDELNSILQVTQKKIHRFKASCSSLTSLLKFKLGTASSSESVNNDGQQPMGEESPCPSNGTCREDPRSDLGRALDNHVDRLDSMIEKAENAQFSMTHQSKEMKRFLQ